VAFLAAILSLLLGANWAPAQSSAGLRVPAGFEVTEYADSRLANDIFCMTLDPRGRVVVSGRGYVRILVDDDNDGRADRAIPFASGPKEGAQGLLWEGQMLYVTGDGGLRRYRAGKDGMADGPSELIRAMKTGGEHAAHALGRGPDGWLYVLCGNTAGIDRSFAQVPTSPVRDPVAGCVLRFSPDLKSSEIVADGFRNPYGMDFNLDGELFTFDSDHERCVSLPWYEFTRLYHVIPGGHYGWQAPQRGQFWRMPPCFCDVVAPVATFGRGSPTGVVCYRHTQFPEHYRGGLFLLDWTFGRVYFARPERAGASYTCRKELFLQSEGDNGFAPTAVVVHPDTGDLYIAIGGRGTRGAVYRIRHTKGFASLSPKGRGLLPLPVGPLDRVPGSDNDLLAKAASGEAWDRLQALIALRRFSQDTPAEVMEKAVRANWNYNDRYVRKAAAELIALLGARARQALARQAQSPFEQTTLGLATFQTDPQETIARACRLIAAAETPTEPRLAAVRLVQKALGDLLNPRLTGTVWEGYSSRRELRGHEDLCRPVLATLREAFPTSDRDLDRELARTLAMLEDGDPATLGKVADRITATSDPVEDIHYLIVLARLRAPRTPTTTAATAPALLALDRKLADRHQNRDTNWPLRIAELYGELARQDPGLHAAMLAHPDFGRADHALFARAPGFDRRRAARVFLKRAHKQENYPWNAALIAIIGDLPEQEFLPVFRDLWGNSGLDVAILPYLARHPQPADRAKFIQGLASSQVRIVRLCVEALQKLPARKDGAEVLALLRALEGLPEGAQGIQVRQALGAYLQKITGQSWPITERRAWMTWFGKTYPELAVRLTNPDGVDVAAWEKRLARLDWAVGNAERGQKVFTRTNCASCHGGAQALGPDLGGVASRFSRADLFTAIIQPSRDVSPRYQSTVIETTAGKIYQGLIIYQAVDGMILQTGPATTVRLAGSQIASRRVTRISLMPPGLLDALADRDIADLYAYLRALGVHTTNHDGKAS